MAASALVEFVIKWAEQNGQLPGKVQADIDRLTKSGAGGGTAMDRLGEAFGRLEQREPTMVMRRVRMELESLMAQAVGAEGPIGRLGASLALMGSGGGVGLAAIGGFAALGLGIKGVIDYTDSLNESFEKLGAQFSPGGAMGKLLALGTEEGQKPFAPEQPKYFARMYGRLEQFGLALTAKPGEAPEGQVQGAFNIRAEAGETEEHFARRRAHADVIAHHAEEVAQKAAEARSRQRAAEQREREREQANYEAFLARLDAAFVARQRARGRPDLQLRGGLGDPNYLRSLAALGPPPLRTPFERNLGYAEYSPGYHPLSDEPTPQKQKQVDYARLISASFAAVGSAQGGAGGTIAGLGGVLAAVPGMQVPGAIVAGMGGLVSLFESGNAKVQISQLSDYVLNQLRNTIQLPTYLSEVLTGVNPNTLRGTAYQQGRMTARDAVPRTY